jgi:hypothetical protein
MNRTGQGMMSVLLAAPMTPECIAGGQAIFASSAKPPGVRSTRQ